MIDEVEVKKMALAQHLGVDLDEIEECSWDEASFSINPRMVKDGKPPEYWIERGTKLREMLDNLDPEKDWEDWAQISDDEYMDAMLFMLSQHPGYNTGKYATAESKAVEMYYRADPHDVGGAGAKMREMRDAASNQRLLESIMAVNKREFVIYDKIKFALQQAGLRFDDFGINTNDLWHLIAGADYYDWHVYAIRAAFNGEPVEDKRRDMHTEDGSYLVLTDQEADERVKDYIKDSVWAFNSWFLANQTGLPDEVFERLSEGCENSNEAILALVEQHCGLDNFVEEAVCADGRGHFLSDWDGSEKWLDFEWEDELDGEAFTNEETFCIYRNN